MRLIIELYDVHTREKFLARAVQMDATGKVTHFSLEGSPNTTWEKAKDFEIRYITVPNVGEVY